jgi:LemA protein
MYAMIFVLIFLVLIVLPVAFLVITYNGMQRKKIRVEGAWSNIATHLQQRADLIPNLVETVKGYVGHEKETLIEVTRLRNQSVASGSRDEVLKADAQLSRSLIQLTHVVEQYPNLKADSQFGHLQGQLQQLEMELQSSRAVFNAAVEQFNTAIVIFPNNLVAGFFNFEGQAFYKEQPSSHEAPKVLF